MSRIDRQSAVFPTYFCRFGKDVTEDNYAISMQKMQAVCDNVKNTAYAFEIIDVWYTAWKLKKGLDTLELLGEKVGPPGSP